jgi:hypothetical protein
MQGDLQSFFPDYTVCRAMDYDNIKGIEIRGLSDRKIDALVRVDLHNIVSVFFRQGSSRELFEIVIKPGVLMFTKKFGSCAWAYLQKLVAGKILTEVATIAALEEINFSSPTQIKCLRRLEAFMYEKDINLPQIFSMRCSCSTTN